jgi:hypothetical protein
MSKKIDPVDDVLLAFLDYLEGTADRPTLDHLTAPDRERAQRLIDSLEAGRGINPYASRPSVEALLTGAGLDTLLAPGNDVIADEVDVTTVRDVLLAIDERARVDIENHGVAGETFLPTSICAPASCCSIPTPPSYPTTPVRSSSPCSTLTRTPSAWDSSRAASSS